MVNARRSSIGPSDEQWFCLIDTVLGDREMLTNTFDGPMGLVRLEEKWNRAANEVNKIGPICRTGAEWKTDLTKIKARAKKRFNDLKGYMGTKTSGGGPPAQYIGIGLNPVYEKCMSLIKGSSLHGNLGVKTSVEARKFAERSADTTMYQETHDLYDYRRASPQRDKVTKPTKSSPKSSPISPRRRGFHGASGLTCRKQWSPTMKCTRTSEYRPLMSPSRARTLAYNVEEAIYNATHDDLYDFRRSSPRRDYTAAVTSGTSSRSPRRRELLKRSGTPSPLLVDLSSSPRDDTVKQTRIPTSIPKSPVHRAHPYSPAKRTTPVWRVTDRKPLSPLKSSTISSPRTPGGGIGLLEQGSSSAKKNLFGYKKFGEETQELQDVVLALATLTSAVSALAGPLENIQNLLKDNTAAVAELTESIVMKLVANV